MPSHIDASRQCTSFKQYMARTKSKHEYCIPITLHFLQETRDTIHARSYRTGIRHAENRFGRWQKKTEMTAKIPRYNTRTLKPRSQIHPNRPTHLRYSHEPKNHKHSLKPTFLQHFLQTRNHTHPHKFVHFPSIQKILKPLASVKSRESTHPFESTN